MPQGKLRVGSKSKSGNLSASITSSIWRRGVRNPTVKPVNVLKKGAKCILPKKAKSVYARKVRKGLETAVKNKIEDELKARASTEGKPFQILKVKDAKAKKAAQKK